MKSKKKSSKEKKKRWRCPKNHKVSEPGQMGRSWCNICENYEIPKEIIK